MVRMEDMRVRPTLLFCGFLDLWLGFTLVLTPSRPGAHPALFVILDYGYGSAFLLAALACFLAALLWSRRMQRRLSIRLIRFSRLAGLGASFSVMLALLVIEVIALLLGGSLLSVGIVAGLAVMEAMTINEADMTPAREAYIYQYSKSR